MLLERAFKLTSARTAASQSMTCGRLVRCRRWSGAFAQAIRLDSFKLASPTVSLNDYIP